jgi:hypothetical protein
MNGRNCIDNNFTSYTHSGQSVVDYGIVPYEYVNEYRNFQVIPPLDLFNKAGCTGVGGHRGVMTDHALLVWEVNTNILGVDTNIVVGETDIIEFTRYDLAAIPPQYMNNDNAQVKLTELGGSLDNTSSEMDLNSIYMINFVTLSRLRCPSISHIKRFL